jgi:Uma2 family endonuclease
MNDAAVFIETGNCVYYPDVVVSCGKFLPNSNLVEEPVFIVEVLSTSTAATDRREKLLNYTSLKSLKEYLIIHQKFKRLELYRRTAAGSWEAFDYKDGELELLSMPSGPLKVSIDLIYENAEGVKNWKVLEETPPYTFEYYEQEGVFGW